jgi:hypothetical protein
MSESVPATSIAAQVGAAVGDCAATAPSTTAIRSGLAPEAAPILCLILYSCLRQPLAQRRERGRAPARLGSDRADRYGTADALALLSSVSGP